MSLMHVCNQWHQQSIIPPASRHDTRLKYKEVAEQVGDRGRVRGLAPGWKQSSCYSSCTVLSVTAFCFLSQIPCFCLFLLSTCVCVVSTYVSFASSSPSFSSSSSSCANVANLLYAKMLPRVQVQTSLTLCKSAGFERSSRAALTQTCQPEAALI